MISFNLILSEEIIQYSRTFALQVHMSWKQAHAPLLVESFPKTRSEASWFGGSHNYKTKQNKLPFLHRETSVACTVGPSVNPSSTDFFLPEPGFLKFI
jgi:hypothetical protein